jgi:hypothetical protein
MPADFKQSVNLAGKVLAGGQVASATTDTTIYTVPASSATKIATASLTNVTGAAVTVTVSVVPSGSTIDGTRKVLSSYSLAANDTISAEDVLSCLKGAMLDAGAFISVNASAATAVNYLLTGAVSS